MDINDILPSQETIDEALRDAVDLGWLAPVDHGFCFSCNEEKAVYEVVMEGAPVQPPKCSTCFFTLAHQAITADPQRWLTIRSDDLT